MFKKKSAAEPPRERRRRKEPEVERAYEDSWYRSLKAKSDRPEEAEEDAAADGADT
jgi:hypothetical protein